MVGPLLLGDPAPGVGLDLAGEARRPGGRRPASASSSAAALGEQRGDDPVDELGRRDPLQRGVRRPARQPRAAARHRAEPADHLDGQPGQPLLVAVGERVEQLLAELGQRLGVVADRPAARRRARRRRPARPRRRAAGSRRRTASSKVGRWHLLLDQRGGVRVADGARGRPTAARDRAATASRSSASETGQARRRAAPRGRRCAGRRARCAIALTCRSRSSRTARSWSEACLRTTPRVSSTALSSRSRISSAIRVRAQSTDSAIDGAFFSSSSRSRPTVATSCSATLVLELGHLRQHDLPLALGVRVVEVQVEAAPLEGLGQLAARVGGEDDERAAYGGDGAELRDRHLEVREHLEQQPLDLDVGLVDLVDEQHRRLLAPDRGQQRPGEQELLGEDVVVGLRPRRVVALRSLDAEQLLLVVPLVERPRLVEALVALQPDQVGAGRPADRLGQLGLADAGRTLDEQRLLERAGEVRRGRGRRVGEVADLAQPGGGVVGRGEPGHARHPRSTGPARDRRDRVLRVTPCGGPSLRATVTTHGESTDEQPTEPRAILAVRAVKAAATAAVAGAAHRAHPGRRHRHRQ